VSWERLIDEAQPFGEAIGERLRLAREHDHRTTEHIAASARQLGLSWHRTTVGQTERGKRALSAAELLLLPVIYRRPLRELLPPADGVTWLTGETAVHGAELRRLLDDDQAPAVGERLGPDGWHLRTGPRNTSAAVAESLATTAAESASRWPVGASLSYVLGFVTPDETEAKAAKRLDTTAEYVAFAARETWGRGLAEERDRRLAERPDTPESARALQAARGHITRTLISELEPVVREVERQDAARGPEESRTPDEWRAFFAKSGDQGGDVPRTR